MEYIIAQDFYVPEFDIQLNVGGVVYDGDLEPDLTAQLVSNGVLVSDSPAAVEADEQPIESKPDIEDLTLAELREEASQRGLPFTSRMSKAELIALIETRGGDMDDDEVDSDSGS